MTTKGVKYLSGPSGLPANPNGNWSIVGFIESDAMLAKDSTIIRIPLSDIKKIGSYSINSIIDKMFNPQYFSARGLINGQEET
jgi:hypothetical protein